MLSIWHWHTEPFLVGGILAVVWLYAMLVGPLRNKLDPEAEIPRVEIVWFTFAVITFYGAVGSPIDAAGENFLFSAHMFQHNILMYLTAAFSVLALPGWFVDGLLDRARWSIPFFRVLFHPVIAGFLFTFVFYGWHAPALYEWALHNKVVHTFEHLSMLGTSIIMFWPMLSRSRTLPQSNLGSQILYLFVLMVAQIPLFGLLTFAEHPLYPTYEYAPRLIEGFDPLSDQVFGGLLMKVANMILSLILMGYAFFRWNAQSLRTERPSRVETHRR
jgi:putative membrane protein|tara:strand:+ start:3642 stop:4460 length:819 start_codon:yes stop_codon:yes gene_type:complete